MVRQKTDAIRGAESSDQCGHEDRPLRSEPGRAKGRTGGKNFVRDRQSGIQWPPINIAPL